MTQSRSRKAIRPRMSSEGCGSTGLGVSSAARIKVFTTTSPYAMRPELSGRSDEEEHEADQGEHLDEHEGRPRDVHQRATGLRLTSGAVDDRGPDETHADAGADRAEAVADQGETRVDVDCLGGLCK